MRSSAPMISDPIELQVLSFCLVELTMGNPLPKDRPPPHFPCMLGWTANAASTHHFEMPVPLTLRISGSVCASELCHQVNQFAPIIHVGYLHSHHQEFNSSACIGSGSFGGI
jgi:hypothetical protein